MNKYFNDDGHLSDYALKELINGGVSELVRLETAEHLSFCDECTERYADMLCDDCLISPPEPMADGIMARLRKRARVIFLNRYVAAGAAACFAIILWMAGVFDTRIIIRDNNSLEKIAVASESLGEKTYELSSNVSAQLNEFFTGFNLEGVFNHEKK